MLYTWITEDTSQSDLVNLSLKDSGMVFNSGDLSIKKHRMWQIND